MTGPKVYESKLTPLETELAVILLSPTVIPPRLDELKAGWPAMSDLVDEIRGKNLSCCNTPLDEHKRCSECGENC